MSEGVGMTLACAQSLQQRVEYAHAMLVNAITQGIGRPTLDIQDADADAEFQRPLHPQTAYMCRQI
jgi:hypothetical protein